MSSPDLNNESKELIKNNHDALVAMVKDVEWIKNTLEDIKDSIDKLNDRVLDLEKFKSKVVGVAVGVSTVVSLAVAVVFRFLG